jgi:hypothetical protein
MTIDRSPQAALARARLAQVARLVALDYSGDPRLAKQPEASILLAVAGMIRDCVSFGVPSLALEAATHGACWIGDLDQSKEGAQGGSAFHAPPGETRAARRRHDMLSPPPPLASQALGESGAVFKGEGAASSESLGGHAPFDNRRAHGERDGRMHPPSAQEKFGR